MKTQVNNLIRIISIILLSIIYLIIVWITLSPYFSRDQIENISFLPLFGVLVTTTATLIGILIKSSIDSKNQSLIELESDRNHILKEAEHEKNKIELSIKTSQAIGEDKLINAALIFSLISLRHYSLAITLLTELVEENKINFSSLSQLVSKLWQTENPEIRESLASLMENNVENMIRGSLYIVHSNPVIWPQGENEITKLSLLKYFCFLISDSLRKSGSAAIGGEILYGAMQDESPFIRTFASSVVRLLHEHNLFSNFSIFSKEGNRIMPSDFSKGIRIDPTYQNRYNIHESLERIKESIEEHDSNHK